MPFKSEAQRRKFYAMANTGEISGKTLKHWQDATGDRELPMRVKSSGIGALATRAAWSETGAKDKPKPIDRHRMAMASFWDAVENPSSYEPSQKHAELLFKLGMPAGLAMTRASGAARGVGRFSGAVANAPKTIPPVNPRRPIASAMNGAPKSMAGSPISQ